MTKRTGRCACGAVTWQTSGPVLWAGHCHCDSCRRASAAPVTSFFGVPRDRVTWTGEITDRQSSDGVHRGFCASCGSQLYYQADVWPDETHLFAATLDDHKLFEPQAHYHWAERVSWMKLADDLPKYAGSADGHDPL
ncbi:Glutathione-dependent formaldehyde-activating enzyme [Falsiruegeria litorea R37]|uniref:Glutathione-dependent formaldehyde-activating enzyme n=1 Tax=Falsiruegeria litorea R37 TaxID=1200284 RepID=A0A1Y5RQD0_9RHOB|nr:GFA family protein [Falsiruegeria litorea]SLN22841.1 Glutathione-dependent formaldehyde-activating enzyme [Falsiruegeria litorea R37]